MLEQSLVDDGEVRHRETTLTAQNKMRDTVDNSKQNESWEKPTNLGGSYFDGGKCETRVLSNLIRVLIMLVLTSEMPLPA